MVSTENQVVIISGMHRSGTSLVASLCQSYGVNIGRQLMEPHASNPRGHYEDLDFVRLHETTLASLGFHREGYCAWQRQLRFNSDVRSAAIDLINYRSSIFPSWGWKDPRTILFLDAWNQLLPCASFIFAFRDPAEVVSSLLRRGEEYFQDDGELALREWYSYNLRIFDFYTQNSARCLLLNLNDIRSEFQRSMDHLKSFLKSTRDINESLYFPELLSNAYHLPHAAQSSPLIQKCYSLYQELKSISCALDKSDSVLSSDSYKDRVVVILPLYRLPLTIVERISLAQLQYQLPHHKVIIIKPLSLDTSDYRYTAVSFSDHHFESIQTYSDLLLTLEFYDSFSQYEYILIHQLDALVMSEDLLYWCDLGWDYVGAPWMHGFSNDPKAGFFCTGNGGLSLRRVAKFLSILSTTEAQLRIATIDYAEDLFWSFDAPLIDPSFTIPSPHEARFFSAESCPRHIFRMNGNKLPFGCHYWHRVDPLFWVNFLSPNASSIYNQRDDSAFDNPLHPDYTFLRRWSSLLISAVTRNSDPLLIGYMLTADIPDSMLDNTPDYQGVRDVFDRILQRQPNAEWLDFWVGKSSATLRDMIHDLARGPEFKQRMDKMLNAALSLSSEPYAPL